MIYRQAIQGSMRWHLFSDAEARRSLCGSAQAVNAGDPRETADGAVCVRCLARTRAAAPLPPCRPLRYHRPLQHAILTRLADGPATLAELAAALGRIVRNIDVSMSILHRHGLVRPVGKEGQAVVWELVVRADAEPAA